MPLALKEVEDTTPQSTGLKLVEVPYEPEPKWYEEEPYTGDPSAAAGEMRGDIEEIPVIEDRYSQVVKEGIVRGVEKIRTGAEKVKTTQPQQKSEELVEEIKDQAEDLPDMGDKMGVFGAAAPLAVAGPAWIASKIGKYSQYLPERGVGEDVDVEGILSGEVPRDERSLEEREAQGKEVEQVIMGISSLFAKEPEEQKVLETVAKPFEYLDEALTKAVEPLPDGLREPVKDFAELLVIAKGPRVAKGTINKIKNSTAFRKATIKERGLVVQDLAETLKKNPNITEGELARMSDRYFEESLGKGRAEGEGISLKEVKRPEPEIKPEPAPKSEPIPEGTVTRLNKKTVSELKSDLAKLVTLRQRYKENGIVEEIPRVDEAIDTVNEIIEEKVNGVEEVIRGAGEVELAGGPRVAPVRTTPPSPGVKVGGPVVEPEAKITTPKVEAPLKDIYNEVIESLPEEIKKDIDVKSVRLVKFSEWNDGVGGMLHVDGKGNHHVLIEKGEKDIKNVLRHELIHSYGLNHPELSEGKGLHGEEATVEGVEKELDKPKIDLDQAQGRTTLKDIDEKIKAQPKPEPEKAEPLPKPDTKPGYAWIDEQRRPIFDVKPYGKKGKLQVQTVANIKNPSARWKVVEPGDIVDLPEASKITREELQAMPETVESRTVGMAGENYEGFIGDKGVEPPAGVKPSKKPIKREDILIPLMKSLGVSVYEGRVKSKKALGFYRSRIEEVRTKNKSDLEVAAHEIAHWVDDRVFHGFSGRKKSQRPWLKGPDRKTFATELKALSYDKKKAYEGFAEFVRHWMTNPDVVAQKAPEFLKYWENLISTHEYGPAIKKAQKDMRSWFAQDKLTRARSKVGVQRSLNESLDNIWDKMRQGVVDDLHGVLRSELAITGKRHPGKLGAYETARLSKAAYSIVSGALEFGALRVMPDKSFKYVGRGLKDILGEIKDVQEWSSYAIGRSARELMSQGRENLFTKGEIEAMVKLETPENKRIFDEWLEFNEKTVDFAQDLGLINSLQRANWKRTQYLPFYRVGSKTPPKRLKGIEGDVTPTYILTGGTGNLNNIIHNMVQNTRHLMVEAIKNDARLKIVDSLLGVDKRGGGRYIAKIPKDTRPVKLEKDQIKAEFYKALGIDPKAIEQGLLPEGMSEIALNMIEQFEIGFSNNPDFMQFWLHGQSPKGDNVVAVRRGGNTEYYEVFDPLLYRAISSLNPSPKHPFRRFLNTSRRVGQGTVTLSLDFMTANLWRDTWHGWVFSDHGFKPVASSLVGMKSRIARDQSYKDFIANGGGMASYLVDPVAFEKRINKFYKDKGINPKNIINTPGKMLYALEAIADAFEMSTRIQEFKNAVRRGEHPRHASYLAREISTDFAMKGDSEAIGWAYDSILFLKAAMNGLDRVYRGVTKDRNRSKIWLKSGMIAGLSVGLYLLNRGRPEYEDQEDWFRDSHWSIFLDREGKEPIALHFPKLWEIGAMASTAERSMEYFLDSIEKKHPEGGKEFTKRIGQIFLDQFKFDYMPYVAEAPFEVYALNKERFTGRPIETEAMKRRQPFARFSPYTNRTLVEIAEKTKDLPPELQLSPEKMEAMIRGYLNTFGLYGLFVADALDPNTPAKKLSDYPVFRRFYSQQPRRTKYNKEFWKYYKDATELHNTVQFFGEQNRPEVEESLLQKDAEHYYDLATGTFNILKDIRKDIEVIYMDESMDPKQKRREIDQLKSEMEKIMKESVLGMKDIKRSIR